MLWTWTLRIVGEVLGIHRGGPLDNRMAGPSGMTESNDFIVQMAEQGSERNGTCPRSHSKLHTETSAEWGGCAGDGVWREEAHLVWPPAGLQLMAHKLKADSEEWGPAAESKPITEKLYVRVKGSQKASHQAYSPSTYGPTLHKPPTQGAMGATDMRAGALVLGQVSPNA